MAVPVLVITGAVGVGKTTVSYEVRLQLRDAGVSCVLIDDEFALFHPRPTEDPTGRQTSTRALASLWSVYREAGIERLLLASVLESSADLDRIREAVPGADIQVFLLTASLSTLEQRIRAGKVPTALQWCLDRSKSLVERWEQEPLAHAQVIDAGDPLPAEIAAEVVSRSGWLEGLGVE
jgi:adenylylsulfate kinase-like enzyme